MVDAWIYCTRTPSEKLKNSGLPLLFMSEADLKNTDHYQYDSSLSKEYDFIYICLDDDEKCNPGWQSYNRNWELCKKCLEVMCNNFKLKGLIVGRTNCDITINCKDMLTIIPFLPFYEFQDKLKRARFIFIPNISDASPRVITEALCYNIPAVVNYNIFGGWHNVIPNVTGEFFTSELDVLDAINKIITNYNYYNPRDWFIKNRGYKNSSAIVASFLVEHYPNINNKNVRYVAIP